MYIKKLETWNNEDWNIFFNYLKIIESDKRLVKQILTLPKKEHIEHAFWELKSIGIINGIGPSYFMSFMRKLISLLFKGVRYERHDIMYAIGGSKQDKKIADKGLLKYSKLTIRDNIKKAKTIEISFIFFLLLMTVVYITSFFQYLIALFCYFMVRVFGASSFRFTN